MPDQRSPETLFCLAAVDLGLADRAQLHDSGVFAADGAGARQRLIARASLGEAEIAAIERALAEPAAAANLSRRYSSLIHLPPAADDSDDSDDGKTLPSPSASRPSSSPDGAVTAEQPGRYTIFGEHGRGGIGRVMVAFDRHTNRQIALKELLVDQAGSQTGSTPATSNRFLREARVTAGLEHPNIVPVYEVGRSSEGRLYYTMRLVRGRTLAAALAECRSLESRLKWLGAFWDLCNAISFAHSRGVLHRDLKPQNVMVGEFGETVVLDWGLAKVLGQPDEKDDRPAAGAPTPPDPLEAQAGVTVAGFALGTPEYMSPEQARGALDEVDGRTDVWGLGAVLYEILTGQPPFGSGSPMQTLAQVIGAPLRPVLELAPTASPELAAVAERALRKERSERYQTAKELTADVAAFMTGGRVGAYRYSSWELLKRFAEQNKAALGAALAALLVILLALGLVTKALGDEKKAHAAAQAARVQEHEERLRAHFHLAEAYLEKARGLGNERRYLSSAAFAAASLLHNPAQPGGPFFTEGFASQLPAAHETRVAAVSQAYLAGLRGFAKLEATLRVPRTEYQNELLPEGEMRQVAVSPEGALVAVAGHRAVTLLEPSTGRTRLLRGHGGPVRDAAFSEDGRLLASAGADARVLLWELAGGQVQRELAAGGAGLLAVRFAPGGKAVAAAASDGVWLWELASGQLLRHFAHGAGAVVGLAFSPDGTRVATASGDALARVWSVESGELLQSFPTESTTTAVGFSIDGERLAIGCADGTVEVWPLAGGKRLVRLLAHGDAVIELEYTGDGQRLVSLGFDRTLQLWDAATNSRLLAIDPRGEYVRGLGLSARGDLLARVDDGRVVQLWRLAPAERRTLAGHRDAVYALAATGDGRLLASASWDGQLMIWELASGRVVRTMEAGAAFGGLAFSPDGSRIVGSCRDGTFRAWETATGAQLWVRQDGVHSVTELSVAPDGKRVVTTQGIALGAIRDLASGEVVRELRGHQAALRFATWSTDGKLVLTGSLDHSARIWDGASGEQLRMLEGHGDWVIGGAFSPDGSRVATCSRNREAIVWDSATGRELRRLKGHRGWVNVLRFSPDGRLIATASDDATVRVWSVEKGETLLVIPTAKDAVSLTFLPDGTLALGDGNDVQLYPLDFSALQAEPQRLLDQALNEAGLRLEGVELAPVE